MGDNEEIQSEDNKAVFNDKGWEVLCHVMDENRELKRIAEFKENHVAIHDVSIEQVVRIEVGVNNGVTTPYTRKYRYYTMSGTYIGEV